MSDANHCNANCCPPCPELTPAQMEVSRRSFLAAGGVFMGGLSFAALQGALQASEGARPVAMPTPRKPLIVKPVFVYSHHEPPAPGQPARSWRPWGEVYTHALAAEEQVRVRGEIDGIKQRADYPVEFMELAVTHNINDLRNHPDMVACDVILLYGAGGNINGVQNFDKDVILFTRRKNGPYYLHHQIASSRFIRQHTDREMMPNLTHDDLIVDDVSEIEWRLRALCGLKNTLGQKIVTIGGAGAWAQPYGNVPEIARNRWNFEYHDVSHAELRELANAARADRAVMERAERRTAEHLRIPNTRLETDRQFLVNCFMLDDLFRVLMQQVGTNLITVNGCMGAVFPAGQTAACYTLSTLNDDGYLAFCESDFVVIPSGVLLGSIVGKPVFFCNPSTPHNGIFTIAHCSAPRKMDGKNYNPVRILTHQESDFGAAPWVEAPVGTELTLIGPGFSGEHWTGFKGTIVNVPFHLICRTQFDVSYNFPDKLLLDNMVGFHWMTCFGDYRKEIAYALRRVGIEWNNLDEVPLYPAAMAQAPVPAAPATPPNRPGGLLRRS